MKKKNKWYKDIRIWADIVTIFTIFLALVFFLHNNCNEKIRDRDEYIKQLEAIDFELDANSNTINYFIENEEGYLQGDTIPFNRLYVDVLNNVIIDGKIKDTTLRIKFYDIFQRENLINSVLVSANNKQTILAGSDSGLLIEKNPYKYEMGLIIQGSKDLKDMFHKVRNLISEHKKDIEKTHPICDFF